RFRRFAGRGDPHLLSRRPHASARVGLRLWRMPRLPAARARVCEVERRAMMQAGEHETRRRTEGVVFLVLFGLTIPAANWLIGNVGTVCGPNGPCLIPVAPGLMAPSGVTMIGIALVLRDLVQRRLGVGVAVGAIL